MSSISSRPTASHKCGSCWRNRSKASSRRNLCRKIGSGRAAALEVLIVTTAISNLIREGKTFQIASMMRVGKNLGMVSLNDALMDLVTKKLVAPEKRTPRPSRRPVWKRFSSVSGSIPRSRAERWDRRGPFVLHNTFESREPDAP